MVYGILHLVILILYQRVSKRFDQVLNKKLPYLDIHSFQHDIYDEVAQKVLEPIGHAFKRVPLYEFWFRKYRISFKNR